RSNGRRGHFASIPRNLRAELQKLQRRQRPRQDALKFVLLGTRTLDQGPMSLRYDNCHRSSRRRLLRCAEIIRAVAISTHQVSKVVSHSFNRPVADHSLVACHNCDLLQHLPRLESGGSARCPRCDEELLRRRDDSLHHTLALAIAAAVLYLIANSVPMLGLTVVGREASTTVFGGARILWEEDRQMVAVLVFFTVIIAPALQ